MCHDTHVNTFFSSQRGKMGLYVCRDSFICVTWLIHMCAMTLSYMFHDCFIHVPWLIHTCALSHEWISECIITHLHVRHTHSYMFHDSFIHVPWLIHMCALSHEWISVCIVFTSTPWPIRTCAMTDLEVCQDSFTRVYIHTYEWVMTHTWTHLFAYNEVRPLTRVKATLHSYLQKRPTYPQKSPFPQKSQYASQSDTFSPITRSDLGTCQSHPPLVAHQRARDWKECHVSGSWGFLCVAPAPVAVCCSVL